MTDRPTGWGALFSGRNATRAIVLAGGVVLHAINVYVATTIMPSVVTDIGGLDYYAWSTTLFIVASIVGSALSARLLQAGGPRTAYGVAAGLFGLGTLICALSPSMPALLAGRFVQGFGGGFLFALSYTMIRLVFEESLWPRAIALVSAMWGIATLIGPAIGGTFAEIGAWRAAFWSMLPITILFALLAFAVLPPKQATQRPLSRLPVLQLALLTLSVLAVSLGSVRPDPHWNIAGTVAALLLLALLALVERRAALVATARRLLPRGALSFTAPLGLLFLTMSLLSIAVTSSEIFAPLFLQVLHGQSPLMAGYLAVVMSAGWTIGSVSSSGVRGRAINRAIVLAPALCLAGMVLLALLLPGQSEGTWALLAAICLGFILVGLGVGIGWPHLLTRVLQVAPADEQELASAAITVVQLFATALGAAVAGMVTNLAGLSEPGGVAGTSHAAFWLFTVFAAAPAIGLVTAARCTRLRRAIP